MNEENTPAPAKKYYDYISVGKRTKQDAYFVQQHDKNRMLFELGKEYVDKQTLIVVKNKRSADTLVSFLKEKGIESLAIHGNHRQAQQEAAALAFNAKEITVLITTDKILETLSLENVERLINYDLPFDKTDYFKRLRLVDEIGAAISLIDPEDENMLTTIELMMHCEMEEKEIENFEHTPRNNFAKKSRAKKPRHKKSQKKQVSDREED